MGAASDTESVVKESVMKESLAKESECVFSECASSLSISTLLGGKAFLPFPFHGFRARFGLFGFRLYACIREFSLH